MKFLNGLSESGKKILISLGTLCFFLAYIYTTRIGQNLPQMPLYTLFPFEGDLPFYAARFLASFVCFGVLPFLLVCILGYKPRDLGLKLEFSFFKSPFWWLLVVVVVLSSVSSVTNPAIKAFYPFSKTLLSYAQKDGSWFLLHAAAYGVLYYLPWEFLFRGILIFPFLNMKDFPDYRDQALPLSLKKIPGQFYAIAAFQIIPSTLLHIPHPAVESFGAVIFGIISACLVLKYRSIFPGLLIHAITGLSLDFALIYLVK